MQKQTKAQIEEYLKKHDLQTVITQAVSATVSALPLDPASYLAQELAKASKPVEPCFFSVVHEFIPGKASEFFTMMSNTGPDDWETMRKKHNKLGFHNHSFLPSGTNGPVNCLWECKVDTPIEAFQAFIDGPDGPAPGVFVNKCYKAMPGAMMPASFFAGKEIVHKTEASAGSMFWVFHEFKPNAAPKFWEFLSQIKPDDMAAMHTKNISLGKFNHSFCPGGPEGPCICVWETDKPMDAAEMQKWIDGPDGPGQGVLPNESVFINKVYAAMPGGAFPSAKFTKKAETCRKFGAGFIDGTALEYCTEKATVNPPGAPPMGLPMMYGMIKEMLKAFPQWKGEVVFVEEQDDGTCIVGTQQVSGPMMGDMPPVGPFPEIRLESVPKLAKDGFVFPVEVGRYTLNATGDKVQCATYFGDFRPGVGRTPTPEVLEMWNKKGDLSDVGFGCLYQMIGATLPAPPPLPAPDAIAQFFDGEPMASKIDKLMSDGFADNIVCKFIGPFAPPVPPMDKNTLKSAMDNLIASFPDLTFNVKNVRPKLTNTGAWAADIVVSGTHTGAPFSPMPGKLPAIEPKGVKVDIGPETFTLAADADGKVYSFTVTPLHEGKPAGPPGFYKGIGGKMPPPF